MIGTRLCLGSAWQGMSGSRRAGGQLHGPAGRHRGRNRSDWRRHGIRDRQDGRESVLSLDRNRRTGHGSTAGSSAIVRMRHSRPMTARPLAWMAAATGATGRITLNCPRQRIRQDSWSAAVSRRRRRRTDSWQGIWSSVPCSIARSRNEARAKSRNACRSTRSTASWRRPQCRPASSVGASDGP